MGDEPHPENNQIYLHPLQSYSLANNFSYAKEILNRTAISLGILMEISMEMASLSFHRNYADYSYLKPVWEV